MTNTIEQIKDYIKDSKLCIVYFTATWCNPCKVVAPIIEELATEYEDKANICKCDVEENDAVSTKYGVRNLPTIVFVKGGEIVDRHVGSISKADLTAKIEACL